ncbi:hypothetical protein KUCAC02_034786 [Chaenocephalus aceratus]|nr:hypothetical protein KUCAC02_034786 [Chaenocephalus aceratus]
MDLHRHPGATRNGRGLGCVMDTMRHAHSLESLEMIGRDVDRGAVFSQAHRSPADSANQRPRGGGACTSQQAALTDTPGANGSSEFKLRPSSSFTPPTERPPPLRLDVDSAGRSVLRLSHSEPSSTPVGSYHPTQTPSVFCLDRTMFDLPGDAR